MFMGWPSSPMPLDRGRLCRQFPEMIADIFDRPVTRHDRATVGMAVREGSANLLPDGH
jgi:hypothetical protein